MKLPILQIHCNIRRLVLQAAIGFVMIASYIQYVHHYSLGGYELSGEDARLSVI